MQFADPNRISLRLGLACVQRSLIFSGRSTRTEVISLWLLQMLVSLPLVILFDFILEVHGSLPHLAGFLFYLPLPALVSRRLNDQQLPGLIGAVATALLIVIGTYLQLKAPDVMQMPSLAWTLIKLPVGFAMLFALFGSPTIGPNRYGSYPRETEEQA